MHGRRRRLHPVSQRERLEAEGLALERADLGDREALVALQRAAYARNRDLLGVEPLPLLADYAELLARQEVWVARDGDAIIGAIMLEPHTDHLLLWSIATAPGGQGRGLGRKLLAATDTRARQLGHAEVRLYTGSPLAHLIAWYGRHGYVATHVETLPDRSITHMTKRLG
ncbi:MAG: GNAT family N-acetyltransferase [Hyphomicrobiales bacterium]|nr:MAG: GNAT family N-acetyltransferase [Hyphomicrobiales bacterium]